MKFMDNLVNGYYKLDIYQKVGIWTILFLLAVILVGVGIEIGVQFLGFKVGEGIRLFGIHWHHSRSGSILAFIGSVILLLSKNKYARYIAGTLIIVGIGLLVHHLTTEQCFSMYGICLN